MFSLDYGAEPIIPIEVTVLSAQLVLPSKLSDSYDYIYDVVVHKEKWHNTKNK